MITFPPFPRNARLIDANGHPTQEFFIYMKKVYQILQDHETRIEALEP